MQLRIRIEHLIALISALLGAAALFTVWFSRATLVFHLDEYAGGELDYLARSAFDLAPAQLALLALGGLLLVVAVILVAIAAIRKARPAAQSTPASQ